MKNILTIFFVLFSIITNAQTLGDLFKKKDKKGKNDPNIIRLRDTYPRTTDPTNYDDPNKDHVKNPKLNYLYSNLIPSKDTLKVASFMQSNKIDYNFYDVEGEPIILWVIKKGTPIMLKHFLANGANPNLRSFYIAYGPARFSDGQRNSESVYSQYPLDAVLENFDTTKLNLLKEYGVSLDPQREKLQTYITDRTYGAFMARFLGSSQVAPDALWQYIHLTTKEDVKLKTIQDLIQRKSDVNYVNSTIYATGCLYEAMQRNYSNDIIKLLVEKNADVNLGYSEGDFTVGNYPICFAVKNNNLELVKLFVEKGAKTNIKCNGCSRGEKNCLVQIAIDAKYNDITEYFFSKNIF